jgi:hypothetical protein
VKTYEEATGGMLPLKRRGWTTGSVHANTTPTRVFWEKRLQAIENKGSECEKRAESKQGGGKLLGTKELTEKAPHGEH